MSFGASFENNNISFRSISERCSSNIESCIDSIASDLYCLNASDLESRISHIFNQFLSCILSLLDGSCFSSFSNMSNERKFEVLSQSIIVGFCTTILLSSTLGEIAGILYFANKTRPVSIGEKISSGIEHGKSYLRSAHYRFNKWSSQIFRA